MRCALVAGVLIALNAPLALAQTAGDITSLRKDIDALKEGQAALLRELQQIKNLLSASPPAPRAGAAPEVVLTVGDGPSKGKKDARLILVEFTDYQCPFCSRYVRETYPQIDRDYIQAGVLRYVVRDLPLESIHKDAFKAAEATHCARDQGKYWEMHDRLFANQRQLGRDDLPRHAQAIGLDMAAFERCIAGGKYADAINKDLAEAQRLQVTGTPTFFIGVTGANNSEMKATRLVGAQPYSAFKTAIERLLAAPK